MNATEKRQLQLTILELESRENKLMDWLLDNSFLHPDYSDKVGELNAIRVLLGNRLKQADEI